jgi:hypothetical protein
VLLVAGAPDRRPRGRMELDAVRGVRRSISPPVHLRARRGRRPLAATAVTSFGALFIGGTLSYAMLLRT